MDNSYEQMILDIDGAQTMILESRAEQRDCPLDEKIEQSKRALVLAADMAKTYYQKPLIITYSGGKDSDVLLHLAESCLRAEEFEVLNSHTSVDAPETVYHIREVFKRLDDKGVSTRINYPKDKDGNTITMWNLIPKKKMPPTRLQRYCCAVLKETSTPNRLAALGVREAESRGRQGRNTFGTRGGTLAVAIFFSLDHAEEVHQEAKELNDPVWDCTLIKTMREHQDTIVNPIYEWTDADIWNYIRQENIKTNPLYEKGYHRVGCIGCPLASYRQKVKEFSDYPQYKKAYINAFQKMCDVREAEGKEQRGSWANGESVFNWWMETYKQQVKGQMSLFEDDGQENISE